MNRLLSQFERVYVWDSEYQTVPGWHVRPVCMSATELHSGEKFSCRFDAPGQHVENPLDFGPKALHISYSAPAELGFALAAGWGLPVNVLDLWVEYRVLTNGSVDFRGNKPETDLISACNAYGITDTTPRVVKDMNRDRIIQGHPFTDAEMRQIQTYCDDDVKMLRDFADRILPDIENLAQALHRGRCQKAVACIEWNGLPVDTATLDRLKANISIVRRVLVERMEAEHGFGIYTVDKKGDPHMSVKNYTGWIRGMGFDEHTWEFNGERASYDDEVLEQAATMYATQFPSLAAFRELRKFLTIAKAKFKYTVGPDGRNRTSMMPFIGAASRHQPKTSENISNASKPMRSLLAPHRGEVLIHRDLSNAEYGIAAALSQDKKRWDNYLHRDAYLVKAADFGFCDYTATKATHKDLRNKFKPVTLAGQYGQTADGLAKVLGITKGTAQSYIDKENKRYPAYQAWLAENEEALAFDGYVETECGFRLQIPFDLRKSSRSGHNGHLRRQAMNLPMQGNCAEIMRYACCLATERGIDVGGTCHDSFLYTAREESLEETDTLMVRCINEACEAILGDGYILKSERDVVHFPDHYQHEDGKEMWDRIVVSLAEAESLPPVPREPTFCKFKYKAEDINIPDDPAMPVLHQPGDVCGVETTDDCKWCDEHCKKPDACKVHKTVLVGYTEML